MIHWLIQATIALTTCLAYIFGNKCTIMRVTKSPKVRLKHDKIYPLTPQAIMTSCVLIWFLSFLIITPVIFELSYGNFGFGGFGWDSAMGICEVNRMEICTEK